MIKCWDHMINLELTNRVACRPALATDTEQVIELCSHIWDGNDYIPHVWAEWLADPEGLLGVAELSGRIAGVFKLTKFQDKEWYMEGLRVHPDFRDMGVASHIHNYVVETWRRMGNGTIRLVTHSENVKVHRMCEQTGFTRIAEFIPYQAPTLEGEKHDFTPVKLEEAESALDFVSVSQTHSLSSRLINLDWVYANPQIKHIREAIGDQHAWWWRNGAGFLSIWVDKEDDSSEPGIQLLGCALDDLSDLLLDYRKLAGDLEFKTAIWVAPNQPEVITCLGKAGFERGWDKSLYVYELKSS